MPLPDGPPCPPALPPTQPDSENHASFSQSSFFSMLCRKICGLKVTAGSSQPFGSCWVCGYLRTSFEKQRTQIALRSLRLSGTATHERVPRTAPIVYYLYPPGRAGSREKRKRKRKLQRDIVLIQEKLEANISHIHCMSVPRRE